MSLTSSWNQTRLEELGLHPRQACPELSNFLRAPKMPAEHKPEELLASIDGAQGLGFDSSQRQQTTEDFFGRFSSFSDSRYNVRHNLKLVDSNYSMFHV